MAQKINYNMDLMDIVTVMSEGNIGAVSVLIKMFNSEKGLFDILLCDSLDIRGSKWYMLNSDCCHRDRDLFDLTLAMIRFGIFTPSEIHTNLDMVRAIPFVDQKILGEYDMLSPLDAKWDEFCKKTRESFLRRLNEVQNLNNNKRK